MKTNKLMAFALVAILTFSSFGMIISENGEDVDAANVTDHYIMSQDKSVLSVSSGVEFRFYNANEGLVRDAANQISWLSNTTYPGSFNHPTMGQLNGYYVKGTPTPGTFKYTYSHLQIDITINVKTNITYVVPDAGNINSTYDSSSVTLYNTSPRAGYVLNWYSASSGGDLIGSAGHTVQINKSMTLYGRWVQTDVLLPAQSAHVYVHYRDTVSYTVAAVPPTATITPSWVSSSVTIPIQKSGNVVWIDNVDLASGIYEMAITASASGLKSAQMLLYVHVYPSEVRNLEPYGLSYWSYTVPTYNDLDEMGLISATKRVGDVTTDVQESSITLDKENRRISHTFMSEGLYEFTLRLESKAGDHITTIIRLNVSAAVISGMPACDGIDIVYDTDSKTIDAVLRNPANFASIIWDTGDGTVDMNTHTSMRYSYDNSGIYTFSATLVNSFGQSVTVSATVDAIELAKPEIAYRTVEYRATVVVAATNQSTVTVDCPSWLQWDFIRSDTTSYVRIYGSFTDIGLVGSDTAITVKSNGVTDESWNVYLDAALTDEVKPEFIVEINGSKVKLQYTGTKDPATKIYVQWIAGAGYIPYTPAADGWMHYEYTDRGTFVLTVSAIRGTTEVTKSTVLYADYTVGGGVVNPDPLNPGNSDGAGDGSSIDAKWIVLAIAILAFVAAFGLLYFGRLLIPAAGAGIVGLILIGIFYLMGGI